MVARPAGSRGPWKRRTLGLSTGRHPATLTVMESDFTPEYVATLRRLSGEQKLRTAFALYWSARKLKAAAIRKKHPDWTEEQVQEQVKEIFLHAVT
jgi:hypothetical protein